MRHHSVTPCCPTCGKVSTVKAIGGEVWNCMVCCKLFPDPQVAEKKFAATAGRDVRQSLSDETG